VPDGVPLDALVDEAFTDGGPMGTTYGVAVVHRGRLVAERTGGTLPSFTGPGTPVGPDTPLLSWSMAKSMLHALVGMLVAEGRLDPAAPAPVDLWSGPGDPRGAITLEDLLTMRDGLAFAEEYEDAGVSDVIEMLFGSGVTDTARFAADRPAVAPPGARFNYSSGTSNVVSGIVAGVVGPGDPYRAFLHDRLLAPLGMHGARATFDDAGTWIASSYLYAPVTAFARFGLLYLRDGVWDGRRLLPDGWVDHGRRPRSVEAESGEWYGAHWWTRDDPRGTFWCAGHEGQFIDVCPALDLVVVRLGRSMDDDEMDAVRDWRRRVVDAFDR
jgi:CubicO group peptidase (beta-lactamase class C family)